MGQHRLYEKGSKPDKAKIKREQFFLGPEHGAGVCVYVRGLVKDEVNEGLAYLNDLKNAAKSEDERKLAGCNLLAYCLVDQDGGQMFADGDDVEQNFHVSAVDFVKIMDVMNRLSGLDKDRRPN